MLHVQILSEFSSQGSLFSAISYTQPVLGGLVNSSLIFSSEFILEKGNYILYVRVHNRI
jgi:hypothetical protein